MYDNHYGFSAMPFLLTPDSRFFFGSRGHSRAVAHLTYGLAQGEGFIIVTGEVGTGKTTLVERLWNQLDRQTYTVARISTTQVSGDDLFRLAMAGFGIDEPGFDKASLLLRFAALLREYAQAGRRCLLVVDEVQNLSLAALEELRMLSNITEGGHATLQTILLGQPQFRRMLAGADLEQLRQRVLASYHLEPMSREETRAYIEHRLTAVGWTGNPGWQDSAFAAVFRYTGGVPRKINRLCSRVLLYAALEEATDITGPMVEATAEELRQDLEGGAPPRPVASLSGDRNGIRPAEADEFGDRGYKGIGLHAPVDLLSRVEALEHAVARRERVFQRLVDVFAQGRPGR